MKIIKYKKGSKGKYSIFLDDGRELSLYEEIILKHELLIRKEISEKQLEELFQEDLEYDVYYVALNSIKSRYKSTYELFTVLQKKEYPEDYINSAIKKLTEQGYLNDVLFARSYINNKMITSSYGPLRIENELLNKKIDPSVISQELEVFTESLQREKITKKIKLLMKGNKTRFGNILKQKIVNDLKNSGYCYSLIMDVIGDFEFGTDKGLVKKEYDKLYRKYSRKYSGEELDRIIKNKLYQKGISYEEE